MSGRLIFLEIPGFSQRHLLTETLARPGNLVPFPSCGSHPIKLPETGNSLQNFKGDKKAPNLPPRLSRGACRATCQLGNAWPSGTTQT